MKTCKPGIYIFVSVLQLVSCMLISSACGDVNEDESIYPLKDRAALEVEWSCPSTSQTDVSTAAIIRIKFKKELDPSSVDSNGVLLGSGRSLVEGNVFYENSLLTYVPIYELKPDSRYDVYFTSSLLDIDGFSLTDNVLVFSFLTGNPGNKTCR